MEKINNKKQIVKAIEFISIAIILYLNVTMEVTSNNKLSLILISFTSIYWWDKVEDITKNKWMLHRKNDIELLMASMPLFVAIQWLVLDTRLIYLDPVQAMSFSLGWSILQIVIAMTYYFWCKEEPSVKREGILAKEREKLAKLSHRNNNLDEMIEKLQARP